MIRNVHDLFLCIIEYYWEPYFKAAVNYFGKQLIRLFLRLSDQLMGFFFLSCENEVKLPEDIYLKLIENGCLLDASFTMNMPYHNWKLKTSRSFSIRTWIGAGAGIAEVKEFLFVSKLLLATGYGSPKKVVPILLFD